MDAFHRGCTEKSLHRRWGHTRVRQRDWERLLTLSHCWAATEAGAVVGLASIGPVRNEPGTVDLGIQVADSRHRRGIGTRLIHTAAGRARTAGAHTLHAYIERSNRPMLALLRRLGPTVEQPDGTHLEVRLPLALLVLPTTHQPVRQDLHAHPQGPDRNR
ncbi:GNAT family N-acetyltransferase [Streptomyces sp. NBC_01233]|uniref:GNAT family N-acetyltransferase n=1 Tax=Streptomyces sp. NBC_01233 TaxID=2903787 RepID=UPI002E10A6BC|nr:GNAT family N-acetyltransferase [Streptomyces sp. NBC_01233]